LDRHFFREDALIDKYAYLLKDPWFRLTHLYKIVDKDRRLLDFKPNQIQRRMFDGRHSRNVVLKARQLGSSTFWCIYLLDQVLFNDNYRAGIIGYSLKNASSLFPIIIYTADTGDFEASEAFFCLTFVHLFLIFLSSF